MDTVKKIIIFLNIIVLGICIKWYLKDKALEPLAASTLQVISLLSLVFQSKISKTIFRNIKNKSEIELDESGQSSSYTKIEGVDNSKIKIKKR